MKVRVEQRHINEANLRRNRGEGWLVFTCPVSLAIQEVVGHRGVSVGGVHITLYRGPDCNEIVGGFDHNPMTREWISRFDDKADVQPTVIDLPGLEDYITLPVPDASRAEGRPGLEPDDATAIASRKDDASRQVDEAREGATAPGPEDKLSASRGRQLTHA